MATGRDPAIPAVAPDPVAGRAIKAAHRGAPAAIRVAQALVRVANVAMVSAAVSHQKAAARTLSDADHTAPRTPIGVSEGRAVSVAVLTRANAAIVSAGMKQALVGVAVARVGIPGMVRQAAATTRAAGMTGAVVQMQGKTALIGAVLIAEDLVASDAGTLAPSSGANDALAARVIETDVHRVRGKTAGALVPGTAMISARQTLMRQR